MTGWNGKGAAKRVMIAGASGAAYILVSDQLVKDRWADSEDKELWRGGAQLAGALVIGKGLSKYNRDAALGVAVGGSARGLYRIAQHFGIDETVDRWFSTDDSSSSSSGSSSSSSSSSGYLNAPTREAVVFTREPRRVVARSW
jgi:hypothetical protein